MGESDDAFALEPGGTAAGGGLADAAADFAAAGEGQLGQTLALDEGGATFIAAGNDIDDAGHRVRAPNGGDGPANDFDLVDLGKDAEESGFLEKYPYFAKRSVPAGTYRGVDRDTPSFQDSTLWVANARVPAHAVYDLLSKIYTDEGLAYMRSQKKTFGEMSIDNGVKGIVTPLHPGAERFWKENGVL